MLQTQVAVDSFDCAEVTGRVLIGGFGSGSDISDLSPLSELVSIGGNLDIWDNASLGSLAGLDNLSFLGGNLHIGSNETLTSLGALEGIEAVGGWVIIEQNDALLSVVGLENISAVEGAVGIFGNDQLVSLGALSGLTSLGGSLYIERNPALLSTGGFEGLTSVGGGLYIDSNEAIESLDGLDHVTSVGYDLWIIQNPALQSLEGMGGLVSIEGVFWISTNQSLPSLDGLDALESVQAVNISYNTTLASCSCGLSRLISGDPPTFAGVENQVFIYNNDSEGTCASPEVVLATLCEPVGNEDDSAAPQELTLNVYPNPATGPLVVRYALPEVEPVRFSVYDLLGREVAVLADGVQPVGRHEARLSGLAAGTYIVRIEVGDGEEVLMRRVTVVN